MDENFDRGYLRNYWSDLAVILHADLFWCLNDNYRLWNQLTRNSKKFELKGKNYVLKF